jgi:hypothetical protein
MVINHKEIHSSNSTAPNPEKIPQKHPMVDHHHVIHHHVWGLPNFGINSYSYMYNIYVCVYYIYTYKCITYLYVYIYIDTIVYTAHVDSTRFYL